MSATVTPRPIEKRVPLLHAKALTSGDAPGTFEAIVSVFGLEDGDGDVVEPGSFSDSIAAEYPAVVWSHDWMTPPIGATNEIHELSLAELKSLVPSVPDTATGGLYGKGRLFVGEDEDVPLARHVWAALRAAGGDGRAVLREFSWSGWVTEENMEIREDQPPLWRILKADLTEWGPCLKGVNPDTALVAVKAAIARGSLSPNRVRRSLGLDRMKAEDEQPVPPAPTTAPEPPAPAEQPVPVPAEQPAPEPPAEPDPVPEDSEGNDQAQSPEQRRQVIDALFA